MFQEIDEILSGKLTEEDEDAVLAELDDLIAEEQSEDADETALPDVPSHEIEGGSFNFFSCRIPGVGAYIFKSIQ